METIRTPNKITLDVFQAYVDSISMPREIIISAHISRTRAMKDMTLHFGFFINLSETIFGYLLHNL